MGLLEAYFFRLYIWLRNDAERRTDGKEAAQIEKKRDKSRDIHGIQARRLSLGVMSQGTEHENGKK